MLAQDVLLWHEYNVMDAVCLRHSELDMDRVHYMGRVWLGRVGSHNSASWDGRVVSGAV